MKNLLLVSVFFLYSLMAIAQERQIIKQDGSTTKTEIQINRENCSTRSWTPLTQNFVSKDIKGNAHDLQAYLDQGKPVILDASATWCAPCWELHKSHILKTLHNTYGPGGSDELVVLFVEAWAGNTLAQITGTSTSKTKNGYTHGDWTDGGTIPYPIIDDAAINYILDFNSFPSVFLICPSGVYKDITDFINFSGNAQQEATKIRNMVTDCPSQKPLFSISAPKMEQKNLAVSISADFSVGQGSNLSYAWTFEGGTPANSTTSTSSVVWSETGEYKITAEISNQYGTTTRTKKIIITETMSSYTCDLESFSDFIVDDFAPATTYDGDGLKTYGYGSDGKPTYKNKFYRGSYIVFNPNTTSPPITSASLSAKTGTKYLACFVANSGSGNPKKANDDWFITPKISLQNNSKFSFFAKSLTSQYGLERFNVLISTTDNKPSSFSKLPMPNNRNDSEVRAFEELGYIEAPTEWTKYEYDLSAHNNNPVYIAIQCVSNDAMMFMVDDIEVSSNADTQEYTLSVSPESLSFESTGGERSLKITSNVDWTITKDVEWLSLSSDNGKNNGNITVTVPAYEGESDQTATITVSGTNGVESKIIKVTQTPKGVIYTLSVSPESLSFESTGGEKSLKITSNVDWSITKDVEWLSLSSDNGSQNGDITVTATLNGGEADRSGKITISGTNNVESKIITVSQQKKETSILNQEFSQLLIFPNPAKDAINILNAEGANIIITNSIGQTVKDLKSIGKNEQVDTRSFESGTYFIKILKENNVFNQKIIIVK